MQKTLIFSPKKTMNTQKFIAHIEGLIAKNELDTVLDLLRDFLSNSPKLEEAIHQSGRYAAIRQQIRLGTVSHEDATLTENQIRHGLLELTKELKTQEEKPEIQEEMEGAVSIVNSKNIVSNSNVSAGGNVHIGDKKTIQNAEKIYNIDKIDKANFS